VSAPSSDSAIRARGLTKTFHLYDRARDRLIEALLPFGAPRHRDFHALQNVDLDVMPGECVGIIGLNGSGKSTLLQLVAGVLTPTSGTVEVRGKIAALLELGAGFNPEFTGLENAVFQCSIMGYDKAEIDALLPRIQDFADIGDFVNHPVKTYSSGMYVRLAFAVAITVDPDILIVDEALAVGDVRFQAKCMARIKAFRDAGKTLLFVSHDPGAVKSLCQRAFLLDAGKVVDQGAPDKVYNFYNGLIAEKDVAAVHRRPDGGRNLAVRSGSGHVRIETARLVNAEGSEVETVMAGETVKIEVVAAVTVDTDDVNFGFLIRDRFGNDIYGTNNALLQRPVGRLAAGTRHKITYALPLDLGASLYTVALAAHAGDTHVSENYDWLNDALAFRVVHSPKERFSGYARLRPTFTIEALDR
jgi:lipopolysaccharide transport system ATP-binding protein